jgi:hypothetical protein
MTSDTVKVRIYATEKMRYALVKEVPRDIYNAYTALVDRDADDSEFEHIADRVLDPLNDDPTGDGVEDFEMQPLEDDHETELE